MAALVVRHAVALARRRWNGDDAGRPLTDRGRHQAAALVDRLATFPVVRVVSSPTVRCVDTVAPLARARRLPVEEDGRLAEGRSADAVEIVRELAGGPDAVVLCTHGDVLDDLLAALRAEGAGPVGDGSQKGSTWIVERDTERGPGGGLRARYLPPPA